ncbi:MAG: hypothetical protein PHO76_08320 [Methylotenera sp.]|jgi:hypothetical protein|nr:hypothetical protein [Methylotenera sp.]MDD4926432.1 hypothetical protein [Methylotenera sp.]
MVPSSSIDYRTQYQKLLYLSFVSLKRIETDHLPNAIASGCIVNYGGKHIVLTVSHATKKPGNWAMEIGYEQGKGTHLYGLGQMNFLARTTLGETKLKNIDFSYVEIPDSIIPLRQEINIYQEILTEEQIIIHQLPFDVMPKKGITYGFSGSVMPNIEKHPGVTFSNTELQICTDLEYVRSCDDYHCFKLPAKHPGHMYFEGCSGSPVIAEDGTTIVGLVCGGDENTDEIRVISLSKYKIVLDILVGNI